MQVISAIYKCKGRVHAYDKFQFNLIALGWSGRWPGRGLHWGHHLPGMQHLFTEQSGGKLA